MDKKALDALKEEANRLGVPEVVENMVTEPTQPMPYKTSSCLDRKGVKARKKRNKNAKKARRRNRKKK